MTWFLAVLLFQAPATTLPPENPAASPDTQKATAAPLNQTPTSEADRIRAAMADSLAKQRASILVQAQAAGAPSEITLGIGAPFTCSPLPESELDKMIQETSANEHVDAKLVREVARQESAFRPCAVSPKGAQGLMQLMPATQVRLQVSDPFDAKQSLTAGTRLLKELLDRYHGDVSLALSAYNAGAAKVDQAGGVPDIAETKKYVETILDRLIGRIP